MYNYLKVSDIFWRGQFSVEMEARTACGVVNYFVTIKSP